MRKELFPEQRYSKLLPRGDGPFQVLAHINDNAYKLDLSGEYSVSASFNVSDLSLFDASDDLRANPSQEEGNDANAWRKDPVAVPLGPVMRAQAKKFKEALNNLIQALHKEAANSVTTEGDDIHKLVQLIQVQFDDGPA